MTFLSASFNNASLSPLSASFTKLSFPPPKNLLTSWLNIPAWLRPVGVTAYLGLIEYKPSPSLIKNPDFDKLSAKKVLSCVKESPIGTSLAFSANNALAFPSSFPALSNISSKPLLIFSPKLSMVLGLL